MMIIIIVITTFNECLYFLSMNITGKPLLEGHTQITLGTMLLTSMETLHSMSASS